MYITSSKANNFEMHGIISLKLMMSMSKLASKAETVNSYVCYQELIISVITATILFLFDLELYISILMPF